MYKPPANSNRVKQIKSKFENNVRVVPSPATNLLVTSAKPLQQGLSRQLSDPIKVNIKRSPAFRNDKLLQRNGTQVSLKLKLNSNNGSNKVTEAHCDDDNNKTTSVNQTQTTNVNKLDLVANGTTESRINSLRKQFDAKSHTNLPRPGLRERSNTSAEIIINRQKRERSFVETNGNYANLASLYTQAIPKSERCSQKQQQQHQQENENNIHNAATLKMSDKIIDYKLNASLTDTLKLALKKPLPAGPAPKKPPRTFAYTPPPHNKKKQLNVVNLVQQQQKQQKTHGDPKAMLDKLESALKNNKIRLRRQARLDYTSEEEICDKTPMKTCANNQKFNCLQLLSCSNAIYDSVNERKQQQQQQQQQQQSDEPVYAEPFVFPLNNDQRNNDEKAAHRNSLYYMSSPVTDNQFDGMDEIGNNNSNAEDVSSLSTAASSSDSMPSTPSEENVHTFKTQQQQQSSPKIKDLIKSFEEKKSDTLPMDNRIDRLGKQLRQTIEKSFHHNGGQQTTDSHSSGRSSAEGDNKDAMVGKFETYVRTVRMHSKYGAGGGGGGRRNSDEKYLFHCCLLVGLSGKVPYVKFQFPTEVELPVRIEELIFPDASDSAIDCSTKAQNYSIVLTNDEGKRIYGYCRRVLPENSNACLPLAYCILSKNRAPRFYRRCLEELESRHGIPDKVRDCLLNEFYYHRFPAPGESVRISLVEVNKFMSETTLLDDNRDDGGNGDYDNNYMITHPYYERTSGYNKRNAVLFHNGIIPNELVDELDNFGSYSSVTELVLTLHQDSRYKEKDLEELYNTLNSSILEKVFASLLLERKVIFISCLLGKLSMCIEAIQNMLYPFIWPHTLIPVVPKDLWEIVETPTPIICGALSLSVFNDFLIQDAIVVDLDEGAILMEVGDETKIIPNCLLKEFKDGMTLANCSSKRNESTFNVLLSDAFLRIFINSVGHYKSFIKEGKFQKENFINYHKRKGLRRFLQFFTETTMFYTFIETVIDAPNSFKIFDERILIYSSEGASLILDKMKDWKKDRSHTLF